MKAGAPLTIPSPLLSSQFVLLATAALIAVLPLLGVPVIGSEGGAAAGEVGRGALYRALGFLTTAAPCALTVATLPYVASIAALSQRGVLVKGGGTLDALAGATHMALDKTGTLTSGQLHCQSWSVLRDAVPAR